jgi:LysM repeat protein
MGCSPEGKVRSKEGKMVRIRNLLYIVVLFCAILGINPTVSYADSFLRVGTHGRGVTEVQGYLQQLNYLRQKPNGYYNSVTAEAVKAFQLEHCLKADGIVGPETITAFRALIHEEPRLIEHMVMPDDALAEIAKKYNSSITAIMIKNGLSSNILALGQKLIIPCEGNLNIASRGRTGGIKTVPWSIVNQLWKEDETATIIDVLTGKSFRVNRLYGYYHADVEPLTKTDTETMLEIYGGKWSWDRRAIVVYLCNLFIAASMNGMPHGQKSIIGNSFPGQFCVHFLGSRTHQNGRVDPAHLAMIEHAASYDLNIDRLNIQNRPQQLIPMTSVGSLIH